MPVCTRCKQTKSMSEMGIDRSRKNGLDSWCKGCKVENEQVRMQARLQFLREYKEEKGCEDCGEHFPHYILEFDHVPSRGRRTFIISSYEGVQKTLRELSKCDVVCANCHKRRTWERSQECVPVT